jgi:hypothetical protein
MTMSNNVKVLILAAVGVLIIVAAVLFDRSRTLSLSETVLSLNPGDTVNIDVSGSKDFTVSENVNPHVAAPVVMDGSIAVSAYASGSTTFNVCEDNSDTACVPVYVTVNYSSTTPFANVGTSTNATSSISLNDVPYTGISSAAKTYMFMFGLAIWSAGISYFIVRRKALSK